MATGLKTAKEKNMLRGLFNLEFKDAKCELYFENKTLHFLKSKAMFLKLGYSGSYCESAI